MKSSGEEMEKDITAHAVQAAWALLFLWWLLSVAVVWGDGRWGDRARFLTQGGRR